MEITRIQVGVYDDSYSINFGGYACFEKVLSPAYLHAVTYRGNTVLSLNLKTAIESCYKSAN